MIPLIRSCRVCKVRFTSTHGRLYCSATCVRERNILAAREHFQKNKKARTEYARKYVRKKIRLTREGRNRLQRLDRIRRLSEEDRLKREKRIRRRYQIKTRARKRELLRLRLADPAKRARRREVNRLYCERNREKLRARRKAYYRRNRAECNAGTARWRIENPGKRKMNKQKEYRRNGELYAIGKALVDRGLIAGNPKTYIQIGRIASKIGKGIT